MGQRKFKFKLNSIIQILLVLATLNQGFAASTDDSTYCNTVRKYDGTNLITSKSENQQYPLSKYFSGFNLDFQLEQDASSKNTISIVPGIQKKAQDVETDGFKFLIDQDMRVKTNGDIIFAVLAENLEGRIIVRFGSGTKTSAPVFDEEPLKLPEASGITCFGINLVNDFTAVVDCVQFNGAITPPYRNHYAIVSSIGYVSQSYQDISDCWLYSDPLARKSISYVTKNGPFTQNFLLSYIPFDMDIGEGDPEGYINVFRFVYDPNTDINNGHLQYNAPITNDQLGLASDLQIASVGTLGDFIYVLDRIQGLTVFRYRGNKVVDLHHYFYSTKVSRYGLGINYAGSVIQLVLAEANQLVEYQLYHLDSEPLYYGSYQIDHTLIGTVDIEANSDYLILAQGRLLTIHDRYETDTNYIKAQIQNVESSSLIYSNTLYVFHLNQVVNYILQDPYISVKSYSDSESVGLTITATSTNFDATESCAIYLTQVSVPADSKKVYSTNAQKEIEWTYQTSVEVEVPLEHFYIGPNMNYDVEIVDTETGDGTSHIIRYNEPSLISVQVDDTSEWKNTLIVPSSDGYIYAIHNDSKYNILVFKCSATITNFKNLNCKTKVTSFNFGQPIRDWGFGTWGNIMDVLAVVGDDVPSLVYFYSLLEIAEFKPGDQIDVVDFSEAGWGNYVEVIDFALHQNTIYTILQDKSSRFVGITSKVNDIEHRNTITDEDVGTWNQVTTASDWNPQEIVVSVSHENVIFVLNALEVFIINVQDHEGKFLDYVPISTQIKTKVFANEKSLVIVQAQEQISDRSLFNLNWVSLYEEFEYQTYGYDFIDQFAVAHGDYSGFIYILAYEKGTKNLVCLIYRSGVENIKTLYKVIAIEKNVTLDSTKRVSIDAGGQHIDYVFIQYNGKKVYLRAPVDPNVQIYPLISDGDLYVDYVDLQLTVEPWDSAAATQVVEHQISIVNSQTTIILQEEKLDEVFGAGLYANKADSKTWTENTKSWWEGTVLGIELNCSPDPEVCGKQINVSNIVEQNTSFKENDGVIDMIHTGGVSYILTLGKEKNKKYEYKIEILPANLDYSQAVLYASVYEPTQIDCEFMTPALDDDYNLEFIVLFCFDYVSSEVGVKKVYDVNQKINKGETTEDLIMLDIITDVNRGQYEFFHDRLFVNYENDGYWGGIFIYDLEDLEEYDDLQYASISNIIREKSLEQYYPDLQIASFEIVYEAYDLVRTKQKYVKLFIADSREGDYYPFVRFVTLSIEDNYSIEADYLSQINWQSFIEREKQFVTEDTKLKKIKIIDIEEDYDPKKQTDQVIYSVLIMTSDTAMYMCEFVFDSDDSDYSLPTSFDYSKSSIYQIYNNYGYHVAYPQVHVLSNVLAVAYYNSSDRKVTIGMYDLLSLYQRKQARNNEAQIQDQAQAQTYLQELESEEEQSYEGEEQNYEQNNRKASNKVTLHTMEGGIQLTAVGGLVQDMPPIAFALHMDENNKVQLLTQDMTILSRMKAYHFTPHTISITTTGTDWADQNVTLYFKSDYNYDDTSYTTLVSPNSYKPKPSGGDGGVPGWVIALCVILGVAILGGVGFFIYKKKFASGASQGTEYKKLIKENESDAGFSLQEPTKA